MANESLASSSDAPWLSEGWISNATEALKCLNVDPAPQPLGGLSCTLQILPHLALNEWRWAVSVSQRRVQNCPRSALNSALIISSLLSQGELAIVGGVLLLLWLCFCSAICICCCILTRRKAHKAAVLEAASETASAHHKKSAHKKKTAYAIDVTSSVEAEEEDDGLDGGMPEYIMSESMDDLDGQPQFLEETSAVCLDFGSSSQPSAPSQPPPPMQPPPPAQPPPRSRQRGTVWKEYVDPTSRDKYYQDEGGNVTWESPPAGDMIVSAGAQRAFT